MEFGILDSSLRIASLFENYSSLVWTERYASNGDFTLVSNDVATVIETLPIDTVVSLRNSTVPMYVETHTIAKSLTGAPQITTVGRSCETWLDRRTTINAIGNGSGNPAVPYTPWNINKYGASEAAWYVIDQILNHSPSDIDAIPELLLEALDTSLIAATASDFGVTAGELYAWVMQQLQIDNHGIRAKRPTDGSGKISLEIYKGRDKTTSVVFDTRYDQFDDSTYLLSKAGFKNVAQVFTTADSMEVYSPDGQDHTGLNRRVVYIDGTQDLPAGSPGLPWRNIMNNYGYTKLARALEVVMFSGTISHQDAEKYGVDYDLGDIVKLSGDYGLSQFVQVAEFIRSEDNTGEKAYPTFAAVTNGTTSGGA